MAVKYDAILDELRESDAGAVVLPIESEGSSVVASPSAINFTGTGVSVADVGGVATVDIPGGGGSSLSASYHLVDWASETTWYTGINSSSSSTTDANWTIIKRVLTGSTRDTLTYYTATDQWVNRSTATYATSTTYAN
jgi:hypothetical protein